MYYLYICSYLYDIIYVTWWFLEIVKNYQISIKYNILSQDISTYFNSPSDNIVTLMYFEYYVKNTTGVLHKHRLIKNVITIISQLP